MTSGQALGAEPEEEVAETDIPIDAVRLDALTAALGREVHDLPQGSPLDPPARNTQQEVNAMREWLIGDRFLSPTDRIQRVDGVGVDGVWYIDGTGGRGYYGHRTFLRIGKIRYAEIGVNVCPDNCSAGARACGRVHLPLADLLLLAEEPQRWTS